MPQLGLLLWLLAVPVPELAHQKYTVERPCEVARQIAERRPCLNAEDCGAYRDWKRLFGTPRTEPLDPQVAARAASQPVQLPPSYLCLARKPG